MRIVDARVAKLTTCGTSGRADVLRHGARLCLTTDSGETALGDALPLPGYSPDQGHQCLAILQRWCADLTATSFVTNNVADVVAQVGTLPDQSPSARFALETALLTLLARRQSTTPAELLNQPGLRRWCAVVDVSAPLHVAVAAAMASIQAGAAALKFKVGQEDPKALSVARSLRERSVETPFRIDVNQRWTLSDAHRLLPLWHDLGVEFVEEPVPPAALSRLQTNVPIALDETTTSLGVEKTKEFAQIIVVKPMIHGGVVACQRFANACQLPAIASHLFDTSIALAACCELACALGNEYAHGVGLHRALAGFSEPAPPQLRGPQVQTTQSPP